MDPVKPSSNRVTAVVPPWMRGSTNLLAMVVTAVLVGLLVVLIGWLSPVLAPLGLGMFLAALAAPLFSRLAERGYSPPVALTVTIGVLVLVIGGIVLLAIVSARTLAEDLAGYSDALDARLAAPDAGLAIRDVIPPGLLADVLRVAINVVTQVGGTLLFALVVAALLLLDAPRLTRLVSGGLGSANPVFRQAPVIASAAVTYFVVRIRVNALTAISLFLLMVVVGVDHAPLWAIGAFFLSFVPYLGLILALIPPTILAFAESGPAAAAVIVIGGTVLNLVAENVLEPTLTGRALSLATWLVFVMFFFWVWLMGPIGALLSMPISVLIVLVLRHSERTRWIAELLSREGEPPLSRSATSGATRRIQPPQSTNPGHDEGSRTVVVIFGWGAGEAKDLGEIAPTTCPNCRNQVFLHHIQTKKQVSLYFIPMASYGGTEYLSCPICRHGIKLAAQHQTALKSMRSATVLYRKGGLAEAAYRASVERFWAVLASPRQDSGSSSRPRRSRRRRPPRRPRRWPPSSTIWAGSMPMACSQTRSSRPRSGACWTADRPKWMTTPSASGGVMGRAGPKGPCGRRSRCAAPGGNRATRGALPMTEQASTAPAQPQQAWHALAPEAVLEALSVDAAAGLATAEVDRRRATYGANKFAEAPRASLAGVPSPVQRPDAARAAWRRHRRACSCPARSRPGSCSSS